MRKEFVAEVFEEYLKQFEKDIVDKTRKEFNVDEQGEYVRLESVLPTLSCILSLTPQGIRKYLKEIGVLVIKDNKYVPREVSKLIDNKIYIHKKVLKSIINLTVLVELDETRMIDTKLDKLRMNGILYYLHSYKMSNSKTQNEDIKFDRVREFLAINNK